jgi:hypothetical protein
MSLGSKVATNAALAKSELFRTLDRVVRSFMSPMILEAG